MTVEVPAHSAHAAGKPAGRIRQKNEEAILAAAEEEFARHGFKGTSMNTIAQTVGLPKANLHYYFSNKLGLYLAVLGNILELWDSTFNTLTSTTTRPRRWPATSAPSWSSRGATPRPRGSSPWR